MKGLILGVVLVVPAALAAQSLGDAAAREREKRQKRQAQPSKPARTITQEDLDAAATGRSAWTSADGTFRIAFSGEPEVKDDSARDGGVTYRLAAGTMAYLVNVRSHPASSDQTAALDEVRDAALGSVPSASLMGESAVTTLRGIPGREFLVGFTGRGTGRAGVMRNRAYLAGGRLYIVTAVSEAGWENSSEVVAFLDSFEVLK